MIPSFQDATLAQKQQFYYNAHLCKYCQSETEYVNSLAVYREDYGMIHLCTNKKCGAYVGCLANSDQAAGTTALKPLRDLRVEAHRHYDPLIDLRCKIDGKRKVAQINARKWLSSLLQIDLTQCHIGYMDEELCLKTIQICKDVNEDLKIKAEQRQIVTQERIGAFMFQCARLGLGYKDFNINGKQQYELVHEGKGQCLKFFPSKNEIQWDNGKVSTIENIETFIAENFKQTADAK